MLVRHHLTGLTFALFFMIASPGTAQLQSADNQGCPEDADVQELFEELDTRSAGFIDCLRRTVYSATDSALIALSDHLSDGNFATWDVEFPKGKRLNAFRIVETDTHFWSVFFVRENEEIDATVRVIYADPEAAAQDPDSSFRPEFFQNDQDIVTFLTTRYGDDDMRILGALQGAGATLTGRTTKGEITNLRFDISPPDPVSRLITIDRILVFMTYQSGKFAGISAAPLSSD